MTIAPYTKDAAAIKSIFRRLKQFAKKYKLKTSMGMSNDWEAAIEEGADVLRIGSRIFKQKD